MEGTEDRAIPHGLTEGGNGGDHLLSRDLPQNGLTQVIRHGFHLGGDGGVIVGEIGVVTAGIDDAEVVACGGHIEGQRLDDGCGGIRKVDGHDTAHGTGHLIHQTAGLSKEHVFGVLRDLGDRHLIHLPTVVEVRQDGTHHILKGGRGGQSRSLEHRGHGAGIESANGIPVIQKSLAHTCDEGGGGAELGLVGGGIGGDLYGILAEAVVPHTDDPIGAGRGHGQHVQTDGGGDDSSQIMIGMVTRQLTATGHGKETNLPIGAVLLGKGGTECLDPLSLEGGPTGRAKSLHGSIQLPCIDGGYEGRNGQKGFIVNLDGIHRNVPFTDEIGDIQIHFIIPYIPVDFNGEM